MTMAETTTNGHSQTYVGTRTLRPDGIDKVTGRAPMYQFRDFVPIARFTAGGPVTSLGTQIEKNSASRPPSRMRGMSMLPFGFRLPMSKASSKISRCVVSSTQVTVPAAKVKMPATLVKRVRSL